MAGRPLGQRRAILQPNVVVGLAGVAEAVVVVAVVGVVMWSTLRSAGSVPSGEMPGGGWTWSGGSSIRWAGAPGESGELNGAGGGSGGPPGLGSTVTAS